MITYRYLVISCWLFFVLYVLLLFLLGLQVQPKLMSYEEIALMRSQWWWPVREWLQALWNFNKYIIPSFFLFCVIATYVYLKKAKEFK